MSRDFTGKWVFLSGPMTGKPGWNRAAFAEAYDRCKELGAVLVYDPCMWIPREGQEEQPHVSYMLATLHELTSHWFYPTDQSREARYGAIVMLPGWTDSEGACAERDVALACGIDVVMWEEVAP